MDIDDAFRPDNIDAILRDPNVPADVRAQVLTFHNLALYLNGIDFRDDGSGFLTVVPKPEPAPEPAAPAAPLAPAQPDAAVPEPAPVAPDAVPPEPVPEPVPEPASATPDAVPPEGPAV